MQNNMILVLDFGSQYTQLIARRIRELDVYSEIQPYNYPAEKLRSLNPRGIILSGSPSSIYDKKAPFPSKEVFSLGVPVLGICYGLQVIASLFKGRVENSEHREYGFAELGVKSGDPFVNGLKEKEAVWMSHGDKLTAMPKGFEVLAKTANSQYAAIADKSRRIYGVQFHPEVAHTSCGKQLLKNFVLDICGAARDWTAESYINQAVRQIQNEAGGEKILCAVSGGVDSTVAAFLISRAVGKNLVPVFVNNGVLRLKEEKKVVAMFKNIGIKVNYINAEKGFLTRLKGITDPERKRKIIGNYFIEVFETFAKKMEKKYGRFKFLAQGTLYPDLIESVSVNGPSVTIKSHHNVGGLPAKMKLKLIEPLRSLFKDEVREIGRKMGISEDVLMRQPFPGPGLAVRILGEITRERLSVLKKADNIIVEEIKKAKLYHSIWQSFGVLLPVKTVGVMGDKRTYENVIALRAVNSRDGMTAEWVKLPHLLLNTISSRVINEVKGVNRVVYDISNKPPATIEWE